MLSLTEHEHSSLEDGEENCPQFHPAKQGKGRNKFHSRANAMSSAVEPKSGVGKGFHPSSRLHHFKARIEFMSACRASDAI